MQDDLKYARQAAMLDECAGKGFNERERRQIAEACNEAAKKGEHYSRMSCYHRDSAQRLLDKGGKRGPGSYYRYHLSMASLYQGVARLWYGSAMFNRSCLI